MELVLKEANDTKSRKAFPFLDSLPRELVNRIIGKMSCQAFHCFRRTSRNNADYVRSNRHCFKIVPDQRFTRWMFIEFDGRFSLTKVFTLSFSDENGDEEKCPWNWEERFELQTRCEERVGICLERTSLEDLREILPFWKKMFVSVGQIFLFEVEDDVVRFLIECLKDHPPAEEISWDCDSEDSQLIRMVLMAGCATKVEVRTNTLMDGCVRPVVKEWQNAVRYSFSNIVEFVFRDTERENVLERVCEDVVYTKLWGPTMHAISALRRLQMDDWMDCIMNPDYYMVKRLVPLEASEFQQYALLAVSDDCVRFHVRLDRESFIRTMISEIKNDPDDNEIDRCAELIDKEMIPW